MSHHWHATEEEICLLTLCGLLGGALQRASRTGSRVVGSSRGYAFISSHLAHGLKRSTVARGLMMSHVFPTSLRQYISRLMTTPGKGGTLPPAPLLDTPAVAAPISDGHQRPDQRPRLTLVPGQTLPPLSPPPPPLVLGGDQRGLGPAARGGTRRGSRMLRRSLLRSGTSSV